MVGKQEINTTLSLNIPKLTFVYVTKVATLVGKWNTKEHYTKTGIALFVVW